MADITPLIVYDLDGTLIDTAPDLLDSLNEVVMADGLGAIDKTALRKFVGFGGRVMLRNAYQMANAHLSTEKLDRLVSDFVDHYANNMPGTSRPFDGLLASMEQLEDAGCKFAICTNKTEYLANKLIDALGLSHRFEAITGQDTFTVRKPHKDHLLKTISRANGQPDHALMVGDTPTDFSTAQAAAIPCVGVEFGYFDEPLERFEIAKVISHYEQMTPDLVFDLIKSNKNNAL